MTNLFPPLSESCSRDEEAFFALTERLFPLPRAHRNELPADIARLARLLTSERAALPGGYMGDAALRSAYLHYYLPWNVYRLSRLLPALSFQGGSVLDLGSGPFTLPLALYLSRPDLRALPLRFTCVDRNSRALEAGQRLFAAQGASAWQAVPRRLDLERLPRSLQAKTVTAVNVYNELYQRLPQANENAHRRLAEHIAGTLDALTCADILVVEPGNPAGGAFVTRLRDALLARGFMPAAPCPHTGPCPFPGGRRGRKWCHFTFDVEGSPAPLLRLSESAALPKDSAALSFLHVRKSPPPTAAAPGSLEARVISEPFPLPSGKIGRYTCTEAGMALLATPRAAPPLPPGAAVRLTLTGERDPKTRAPLARQQPRGSRLPPDPPRRSRRDARELH